MREQQFKALNTKNLYVLNKDEMKKIMGSGGNCGDGCVPLGPRCIDNVNCSCCFIGGYYKCSCYNGGPTPPGPGGLK